ncbi:hypothetical protein WDV85_10325 [Pseudokineococcus sp. 5B2Z-1]|uniref:hypothetical protein n=1 Tax=Pseudokineococcus sp. 5B2Z-1 TaxID=3132744 RepID=UPI003099FDB6
MTPARRPVVRRWQRAVQATTASTAAALLVGLAVGATAHDDVGPDGAPAVVAGHHGSTVLAAGPAPGGAAAPAADAAGGRDPHDHGDLEVTVMLGAGGTTRVQGPVEPGDWYSLVNHTEADQRLTTADGALEVDVPLQRLITLQAPDAPGTYRLVSTTDATVVAELVVAGPSA